MAKADDTKKLKFFLFINFTFMFVEILYGILTNSLSLISDAGHMLFDCLSILIGLIAMQTSNKPKTKEFPYGFGRFETLAGFINGVFLIFIAVYIVWESLERLWTPPDVDADRLMVVAVLGLLVNIVGVVFFHEAHHHGHDHSHDHSHSHNHSHSHGHHDHSHGHHDHSGQNTNLYGVYLHIVADALGSVGVIVSGLLIRWFGWHISDPICSLFISVLIVASSIPLLKTSTMTLLQINPFQHDIRFIGFRQQLAKSFGPENVFIQTWRHDDSSVLSIINVQSEETVSPENYDIIKQDIEQEAKNLGSTQTFVQISSPF